MLNSAYKYKHCQKKIIIKISRWLQMTCFVQTILNTNNGENQQIFSSDLLEPEECLKCFLTWKGLQQLSSYQNDNFTVWSSNSSVNYLINSDLLTILLMNALSYLPHLSLLLCSPPLLRSNLTHSTLLHRERRTITAGRPLRLNTCLFMSKQLHLTLIQVIY